MTQDSKVAVITGAAGGIGEATARELGKRGMRLAVADLRADAAAQTCQRLKTAGFQAEPFTVDIGEEASVKAMAQAVTTTWGRIDVLINNAGVESSKPFLDISLTDYERVMRINTTGAWLCCQAVIPVMLKQRSGAIVNISSIAGQRGGGILGTSAYATSKGALIALTKALAREFGKAGIRVNAVAPGLTMTPLAQRQLDIAAANTLDRIIGMTPLGKIAQPEEIAPIIAFLASDDATYATGHVYNIDGGTAM